MERFRDLSIRLKLTWVGVLGSGLALLLAAVAFVGYEIFTFRQVMVSKLSTQAEIIGLNSAAAVMFDDAQQGAATLGALKSVPQIVAAGIWRPDGRLFATYRRDDATPAFLLAGGSPVPSGHQFDRNRLIVSQPIAWDGEVVGRVAIESDVTELRARVRGHTAIVCLVMIACVLATVPISYRLQRVISEPIQHLVEIAEVVSEEKNYTVRAVPAGRDELGVLVEAFNGMLAQIQQRDAELAAANKELEAFSYSVSHDLRAPLRSIDGFSQALLEDYADRLDDEGREYLQLVREATQDMGHLIDDFLGLARVTRSEMHRELVDCSALANAIATELRRRDPDRNVTFAIADDVRAYGDAKLLRIALENLLGNAWKYTSRHPTARIEFACSDENGTPVFWVRDDGAGFDMAYAQKLFGAFQRLHAASEFEGTGVGLATVQRIVHRHGGRIWAEAAVEQGATFYFTLGDQTRPPEADGATA
jgi:signal transduction histidine kinase